jgi:Ca2+-binding RTX toxin-like protein
MTMALVRGTNNSETLDASDGATNSTDWIYGFFGDDALYGLAGDDTLIGGDGADHLDGSSGSDTASYGGLAGVTVDLSTGVAAGGEAEGDTFVSIENLSGSDYADVFIGDDEDNILWGRMGDDTLKGGGGADELHGGSGSDTAAYNDSPEGVIVSLIAGTASGGDPPEIRSRASRTSPARHTTTR